jgi:hypothetical protein
MEVFKSTNLPFLRHTTITVCQNPCELPEDNQQLRDAIELHVDVDGSGDSVDHAYDDNLEEDLGIWNESLVS